MESVMSRKEEKEKSADFMRKEVLKIWCLNPLEPARFTHLGALFEKYLLKYYKDKMAPENFTVLTYIVEATGYQAVEDYEDPEYDDVQVESVDLSGIKPLKSLLGKSFWNVGTLDSMCERVVQYVNSLDDPIVESSVKYVFRVDTYTAEFTFKMNCVRIKRKQL
jgi:hypothetical protein